MRGYRTITRDHIFDILIINNVKPVHYSINAYKFVLILLKFKIVFE